MHKNEATRCAHPLKVIIQFGRSVFISSSNKWTQSISN